MAFVNNHACMFDVKYVLAVKMHHFGLKQVS